MADKLNVRFLRGYFNIADKIFNSSRDGANRLYDFELLDLQ